MWKDSGKIKLSWRYVVLLSSLYRIDSEDLHMR